MKLSVVIPAYNEQHYIGRCLDAITKHSAGRDVEIIVVNNASTDATADVVAKYPNVRLIHEPVKGTNQARNTGFLQAKGDLIANIDADNEVSAGWFDRVLKEFDADPDLAALSGPYIFYDLSPALNYLVRIYFWVAYPVYGLSNKSHKIAGAVMGGNVVIRRRALEAAGGYDTSLRFYGDDTDTAHRLKKSGKVRFDYRFTIGSSARRLKTEGMLRAAYRYTINYVWVALFKRPFHKEAKALID